MASTPRTLRRRKLLHRHTTIDPELQPLYHDDRGLASTSASSLNHSIPMVLGSPSQMTPRTRRHMENTTNIYTPSSLAERLNRIHDMDLRAYEMVPETMKRALSGSTSIFSHKDFFKEDTPPAPASPSSPATSVSETMDPSLLTWPSSPTHDALVHPQSLSPLHARPQPLAPPVISQQQTTAPSPTKEIIPLSTRMQQRFPTLVNKTKPRRRHTSWIITDTSSQHRTTFTTSFKVSRHTIVRLRHRSTHHPRSFTPSVWLESNVS